MTDEQKAAYDWAKRQKYGSVAATYARELAGVIDELQSQLAESQRRERAAVEDLKQSEHDNGKCDYCKHRTDNGGCGNIPTAWVSCSVVNRWEWRGPEKGAET